GLWSLRSWRHPGTRSPWLPCRPSKVNVNPNAGPRPGDRPVRRGRRGGPSASDECSREMPESTLRRSPFTGKRLLDLRGFVVHPIERPQLSCAERKCDRWAIKTATVGGKFKPSQDRIPFPPPGIY